MGQVLRDKHGTKIGEIETSGGKKIIRNRSGKKLGEFDGKVTRDAQGRLVGSGDLLTSLLPRYTYKHSETMQFMRICFDENAGYTVSKLVKEEGISKRWIEGIQIALAGLVAEELILKKHDVGCEKDIEQAYRSSFRLLNRACIEDVRDFCENPFFPDNRVYSESRNRALDDKTLRFIHRNYQKVKRTLRKEKKTISLLASYLMENKGINREGFLRLLNGEM